MATDVTAEGEVEKIAKDTNRKDINRLFNDCSMKHEHTHTEDCVQLGESMLLVYKSIMQQVNTSFDSDRKHIKTHIHGHAIRTRTTKTNINAFVVITQVQLEKTYMHTIT